MKTAYDDDTDSRIGNKYQDVGQQADPGAAKRQQAAGKYGNNMRQSLADQETGAAKPQSADPTAKAVSPEGVKDAESSPAGNLYKGGVSKEDERNILQSIRKAVGRRKKTAIGIGVGGLLGTAIGIFTLISPFKIPAIVGGFDNDIGSSRILRKIVEKRFEKMVFNYLIAKKMGVSVARPGSALDKLHKTFDAVDLESITRRQDGIDFVRKGNDLAVRYKGKEVGNITAHSRVGYDDYKALQKKDRKFGRAAKGIYTKTMPIMRFGDSAMIFRYIKNLYLPHFHTPPTSDDEPAEEKEKKLAQQSVDTMKDSLDIAQKGWACMGEGNSGACDKLDKKLDPIDTADPNLANELELHNFPKNDTTQAVSDNMQEGFQEARKKVSPTEGFLTTWSQEMLTPIIGQAASKVVTRLIPFVGWINLASEIDHAINLEGERHILTRTGVLIKEHQYAAIAALWFGYADETKAGEMDPVYVRILSKRLTGHSTGSSTKFLRNEDPSTGVPVNPRVGSSFGAQALNKAITDVFGCAPRASADNPLGDALNFTYCNSHWILDIWYNSFGYLFRGVDWIAGEIVSIAWNHSPNKKVLDAMITNLLGQDWEVKVTKVVIESMTKLFGLSIEPLAVGGQLANNIYVGIDVILNGYMQRNLGAAVASGAIGAAGLENANRHYYESFASLPLRDRLFSIDVSGSLANRLVIAAPSNLDPGSTVAAITGPLQSLPATFMTLISGRSWADGTIQQRAELDGVAQMDIDDTLLDNEPISAQVADQAEPACPANAEGVVNLCQTDKEIVGMGMCIYSNCPQFAEN